VDKNRPKYAKNDHRPSFDLDQLMDKIFLELPLGLSKNVPYVVWNWSTKMLRISSEAFF
jgi:hypothetical protein